MLQQQQQWETISGDPVALAVARGEPTWLLAERRQAWERACASELPGNDVEAWRRTDLKALGFRLDGLRWPDTAPTVDLPEPARAHLPSGEGESVAVQGEDGVSLLRVGEELAGRGGLWMDLETAARRHPDLVRPHLGRIARADDKLAWLHAAGWRGGLFLYVPRGVELSVPIRCLVWGGTPGRPVLDRTLVVAEEGSAVTLVEVTASPQAPADGGDEGPVAWRYGVVEVAAGPGARVRFCAVQQAGDGVYNFAQRAARVEGGGRVEWMLAEFGGRLTRSSFVSLLVGSGAASEARAVFLAGGRQHMDLVGQHVHCSDHTESDMTVRGVLGDRARSVFRGLIQIDKGARESSAHQREQTLLLSERARTDAIPSLIIDENAVRAGHAATTGPIDREQVFYMMSRGLTEQQATRLIVEGFFAPVVEGIPVDAVRKAVAERMEAYFGG